LKTKSIRAKLTNDQGYLWGAPIDSLTKTLPDSTGFDVLILADLLFNHSEHGKLIKTVQLTLKKSPASRAYVFFTPYRPWLLKKDLAFFNQARESGFVVTKTFEKVMDKVMFEEDPGVSILEKLHPSCQLIVNRMSFCDGPYMATSSAGLAAINRNSMVWWDCDLPQHGATNCAPDRLSKTNSSRAPA